MLLQSRCALLTRIYGREQWQHDMACFHRSLQIDVRSTNVWQISLHVRRTCKTIFSGLVSECDYVQVTTEDALTQQAMLPR